MKLLVTGGAGFIGSAVARRAVAKGHEVVVLDAMTYAASLENLAPIAGRYRLVEADVRDGRTLRQVFEAQRPEAVLHLAAESHVDRSIEGPMVFVETNVTGTCALLQAARAHWEGQGRPPGFRFLHVSTDEVFGELGAEGRFDETTPYAPRSPYAASKAASDHLVRAWGTTYGLPVLLTNCSNNYGPCQFPEKLIPVTIIAALEGRPLPVYGDGSNVRDWIYVEDHAAALLSVLERGRVGRTYAIGAEAERSNLDLVRSLCHLLDGMRPRPGGRPHAEAIAFVADRPGHDARYAIDPARMREELGWRVTVDLEEGLRRTVRWYLDNEHWWQALRQRAAPVPGMEVRS